MKRIFRLLCSFALAAMLCGNAFSQVKPDALKMYQTGNYRQAIEICEQELQENPENINSYVVMCWALIANRQYSECEQRATQARRIYANDVRIIEVLGEAKFYLDKNDDALKLFRRYIELTLENADRVAKVYYFMGEIYIRQARYNHADIALSMAVRYESRELWWVRLGYAREKVGDYSSALVAYNKALSLNPTQQDALTGVQNCQSRLR